MIAQIFDTGGCNSWAGILSVQNDELWFEHRGACAASTRVLLDRKIQPAYRTTGIDFSSFDLVNPVA